MVEIDGGGDAGLLVEVPEISVECRIIDDAPDIALEMAVVDRVEADEGAEELPVGIDNNVAEQETLIGEATFHFVERIEQLAAGPFVGALAGGKAGAVNAVVDVLVKEIGKFSVLGGNGFREEISARIASGREGRVEQVADVVFRIKIGRAHV